VLRSVIGRGYLERGVWSIVLWQARERLRICNSSESENVLRAVGRSLSRLSAMEID
jgi:hypothetical protein